MGYRKQYRSCSSKARFREYHDAQRRANQISRDGGPSLRVYECKYCNGFHLTSQTP